MLLSRPNKRHADSPRNPQRDGFGIDDFVGVALDPSGTDQSVFLRDDAPRHSYEQPAKTRATARTGKLPLRATRPAEMTPS